MTARFLSFICVVVLCLLHASPSLADFIWIEGEKPTHATVTRHPWWYDRVQKNELSGGDYISNWDPNNAGQLIYTFNSPQAGLYDFWVRANPIQTTLLYRLNGSAWTPIDTAGNLVDNTNIAENNALDIRFIAWMRIGNVQLKQGANTVMFRLDSKNNHHGSIDCFVFSTKPFKPRGILKPDQIAPPVDGEAGWSPFTPDEDPFKSSAIDLRSLNETAAGDGGFIGIRDGEFVHGTTGEAVRFWGVNGPPVDLDDENELNRIARTLAKRGVNLVRLHGGYFDESGEVDLKKIRHAQHVVRAMKAQGIYCHFSIFFSLWLHPRPNTPWLAGYDGTKPCPAALFFNPEFQAQYLKWWSALLLTPDDNSGHRLIDDPAVASLELMNEDSLLFWTFSPDAVPPAQWSMIESQFGLWAKQKYGSIEAALHAWGNAPVDRDAPSIGRLGIRPIWQMIKEKSPRDQDTVRFLVETEQRFYSQTEQKLHQMGFKGVITASNWIAATSAWQPLEKLANSPCDFFDRHGYVSPDGQGDSVDWSIRAGQTFIDRSALRFDPHEPGQPRPLSSPVMDPHFDGKPSMLSEVAISRPSRFRSEAPLYFAAYGSLQAGNAIEHFALDSHTWSAKPGYFMQPWSVMSPATLGQFPAAALIYRKRLIDPGAVVADVALKADDLFALGDGVTDGLLGDVDEQHPVVEGGMVRPGESIDPLACFVGRTSIHFTKGKTVARVMPLDHFVDRPGHTVTSSNGQLKLNYGTGVLKIDSPMAQGISGSVAAAVAVELTDVMITSPLDQAHIIVVSLDDKSIATSSHLLLQVMSEEKASGFQTVPAGNGRNKIVNIGGDPWLMKNIAGSVSLRRADAAKLKVTPLDANGYPLAGKSQSSAAKIDLQTDVIYYSIER